VISIIATVLLIGVVLFFIAMWVRFILDWVRVFARRWRPTGPVLVIAELAFTVTDPPIKLVRRVLPPIRIGGARLDFAWSIVFLVCLVLFSVLGALQRLG
jgi:YggT family protein